jgi:hypothetical protein
MLPADTPAARLEAALDALERALREGALADLPGCAIELEAAAAALGGGMLTRGEVVRLRRLVERAQAGLDAARRGVQAARHRLADVGSARAGLGTYDRQGRRHLIDPAGRDLPGKG